MSERTIPSREENTPLELLDIIKRYPDLTVSEFVARVAEDPSVLLKKLEQLVDVGLVKLDRQALDEMRAFVRDIESFMANAPLRDRRAELLKRTSQPETNTRNATLAPSL